MKVIVFYTTECDDKTTWIPWINLTFQYRKFTKF